MNCFYKKITALIFITFFIFLNSCHLGEINIYNVKNVIKEDKKFVFSAEINGKSDLYVCDLLSDTYELKYSSEKYLIKYFCLDGEIIYFIGEHEFKTDIIKLENNQEEVLATFDEYVYSIGKIKNNIFFIIGSNPNSVYIYYFDLNTSEIKKYCDKNFIFNKSYQPVFCPDGDIFIFGDEQLSYVNMVYLIRDNNIIDLGGCKFVQKCHGKIFGEFFKKSKKYNGTDNLCIDSAIGYYDISSGKIENINKYNKFHINNYMNISSDGKYGLAYGAQVKDRVIFLDTLNYYSIVVYNLDTGKQAAVKCLSDISYQIYCWRWLETA